MSPLWLLQLVSWLALEAPEPEPERVRVATITYAGGAPSRYGCESDLCAFESLVRSAARSGASIVVTSEYATPQRDAEPRVALGDRPPRLSAPIQAHFSDLADALDLWLAIDVETENEREQAFNSLVVFDPRGAVAARHDKVELFEGERQALIPGSALSTVETPYGRLGLMICADLYTEPALHRSLVEDRGAQIILVSAAWTVPVATRWQAAFAHDWGVHLVVANASLGSGRGGGVFDPKGRSVSRPGPLPEILLADIPAAPIDLSAGSNAPQ